MLKKILLLTVALQSLSAHSSDFYSLSAKDARGKPVALDQLRGKVVVVANTASKCGYTPQYRDLQKVQDSYREQGVVVLGMPSNSFNQEDLEAGKAAEFCELNYGVTFTILEKAAVKGAEVHPLFKYLVAKAPEGGAVEWNFEKFIIDRTGQVVARFRSSVAPSSSEFKAALEKAIAQK